MSPDPFTYAMLVITRFWPFYDNEIQNYRHSKKNTNKRLAAAEAGEIVPGTAWFGIKGDMGI